MPTIDPNILIPSLLAFLGVLGTACCSSTVPLIGVVFTAWWNNRAAHNRHTKTSLENSEIIDNQDKLRGEISYLKDRVGDLQGDLNDCKNTLARRGRADDKKDTVVLIQERKE